MKRRTALILALLMVFFSVAPQLAARADGVCFTVVNETIYDLSAATMPQTISGAQCVPYTVFTNTAFGLYATYSSSQGTLTFMNAGETLTFDLNVGIAYTSDGTMYSGRASSRNGTIFVPVSTLCQIYGWTWSYLETGPCVRICTGAARVNDTAFISLARERLEQKKNAYLGLRPSSAPNASRRPERVSPSPSASPSLQPVKQIACALSGGFSDSLTGELDLLDARGWTALVFLTPGDFARWDECLLRLVSQGHVPGLLLSPPKDLSQEGQDAWFDHLEAMNQRFFDVTLTRVTSLHLSGGAGAVTGDGADQFFQRLEQAGYRLWDPGLTIESAGQAERLRKGLESASGQQRISVPITPGGVEALRMLLRITAGEERWQWNNPQWP